jgi:hypothetical protein
MGLTITGQAIFSGLFTIRPTTSSPPLGNAAVFGGGQTGSNTVLATTSAYFYSGNTVTAGATLGLARYQFTGAANATGTNSGIFAGGDSLSGGGGTTNYVDLYAFSTNTVTAGTTSGFTATQYIATAGNATEAVFGGGGNNSGTVESATFKYSYSGLSWSSGTALTTAVAFLAAAGNSTNGIFIGGNRNSNGLAGPFTAVSVNYTYSNNTVAAGGSLTTATAVLAGCGNTTLAYFGGGYNGTSVVSTVYQYTYSGGAVTTSGIGTLTNAEGALASAGNSTEGIFGNGATGGFTNPVASGQTTATSVYTFSSKSSAGGTALNSAVAYLGAFSSIPGSGV